MLVLSRKIGQQICLPHLGVIVTVVAVSGGKVRLAVSAPPEVGVYREEVQLRRAAEATKPPLGADDP